ncbi:hypothetical protein BMR11_07995 [Methylococcaceae bacterium CS5]|nr:hypothetical protein BMR10_06695 [Methylococcaceae bacterium CS4]TXK98710.1 hypothetical protein BMR11_07995 [Methylococcaceae bacterium CS5]TXL07355.1 hypothetical protein BMR09_05610 [Methylococcaceae bacterium CS3]TXL09908.1 hypothetical protein BMR08_11770 [Methylococcaceae bacterium CS2]
MIKLIRYGSIRFIFWAILLIAISISGLRYALSELDLYKADIEALLSQQLDAPVTIARVQGVINGFRPELALHDIQVYSHADNTPTVQFQEIRLGINLLAAIEPFIEAIQVSIIKAKLSVTRLSSGAIQIEGLPNSDNEQPDWIMRGKQYKLINSEILWHDQKRNADPVLLKHVNIALYNDEEQHKIFIKTDLPESLGKSLHLAMDFTGNIFVPNSINARLFVQGKDIQLAKFITGDLPFEFSFTRGSGNFSIWSRWQATQMTQMSGAVDLHDATIKNKQNAQFPIDQLDLQFKLLKHQQQWHIALQDSTLSSQKNTVEINQLALALERDAEGNLIHIALNSPQLTLGPLSKLILSFKILATDLHKQLKNIALQGEVKDLLLLANLSQETFAISGQVLQIKSQRLGEIPGIDGLSTYFKGTEQQGLIQLSSQQLNFDAPNLFRKTLNFNHVLGEIHWQHTDAWTLSSTLLELNSEHFKTSSKFTLTLPQNDQPAFMSLRNSFDILDATQAPHFLPTGVINEETTNWLDHAFVAGHVKQGGILLHGALPNYPFRQHKGVFEVLFTANDAELHYAPDWQNIQGTFAEVRFFVDSMNINILQGHSLTNQATIKHATVSIDSLKSSKHISIQGEIESDLPAAISFLKHSPFKHLATAIHDAVDIQGSADINLDLEIPLRGQAFKANIRAHTQGAKARIIPIDLEVSDINADLHFTESGVSSEQLSAFALGFPFSAKLSSNEQAIVASITGQMDIAHLAEHFPNPLWGYLDGTSDYQFQLEFPQKSSQICDIQISSDLVGTSINFLPFFKAEAKAHPFSLKLGIDPSGINTFNTTYENRLAPQNRLDIKLKKIAPHWLGLIHSPIASGSVFIPIEFNKNSEISLSLKKLDLSAFKEFHFENDKSPILIKNLPSISIDSQALYWDNYNYGSLQLQTEPTNEGLSIKQCIISSRENSLSFSGFWRQHKQQNSSSIFGELLSQNFGALLKQTQLSNNIVDTTAELHFALNWPAAPYEISTSILSGSIDSHLTNGRILGVDPGLGRILGALDTWKLGKRLLFDFSDITEEGLSFSESTALLSINKGLVSSSDIYINAMPAKIYLSGSTSLTTEQVDLQATVLPKFPIAGTIIGNIANAVSKTFIGNEPAGGLIVSLLYKIKGTWENFEINRQFSSNLSKISIPSPDEDHRYLRKLNE